MNASVIIGLAFGPELCRFDALLEMAGIDVNMAARLHVRARNDR
ncbi:hypothetical protein PPMP20_29750 [Paraburkholderia phymatum]|nr:hypothetical protein [Paraburkholderia phymatum]